MKIIATFGLKAKLMTSVVLVTTMIGGLAMYSITRLSVLRAEVELLGQERLALTEVLGNLDLHASHSTLYLAGFEFAGREPRTRQSAH